MNGAFVKVLWELQYLKRTPHSKITLNVLKVHFLTDCYCKLIWLNHPYF